MTAAKLFVVVESPSHARVIRALIGAELSAQTRFFAGQGKTSLVTVARNVLFHEGDPVLLVMDADTTTSHLVEEQRTLARTAVENLTSVATGSAANHAWGRQVEVFTFVPEIEVIFFEARSALERFLGGAVPDETVKAGLLAPKSTLVSLLRSTSAHQTVETLFSALENPEVAASVSQGKQAAALREAVSSMLSAPVQA